VVLDQIPNANSNPFRGVFGIRSGTDIARDLQESAARIDVTSACVHVSVYTWRENDDIFRARDHR